MTGERDLAHELRVLARLMEHKKSAVTFGAHDAAHLREAAETIEGLREGQTDDQLAKARLKIEQQANRIDQLEAELAVLREALKPIKRP
jgi:hypothetical protein